MKFINPGYRINSRHTTQMQRFHLYIQRQTTQFLEKVTYAPLDFETIQEEKKRFEQHIDSTVAQFVVKEHVGDLNDNEARFVSEFPSFLKKREKRIRLGSTTTSSNYKEYLHSKSCYYNLDQVVFMGNHKYTDPQSAESHWFNNFFSAITMQIYVNDKDLPYRDRGRRHLFGSLWHLGLINKLLIGFPKDQANKLRRNISRLGNRFNPDVFSDLEGSWGNVHINFASTHVAVLCNYCHVMFGKYTSETTKFFPVYDPDLLCKKIDANDPDRGFSMTVIACIYAEKNDNVNAEHYFENAITSTTNEHMHKLFTNNLIEFRLYMLKHRSSVLVTPHIRGCHR